MSHMLLRQPLYCQVADALAQRIADGEWRPGSTLPNEQDLAREMGVSTGTMRKALDRLETNRLVIRRQGRGTYVEDHSGDANVPRFELLRDKTGATLALTSALLSQELAASSKTEQQRLRLSSSDQVLRTTRIRSHHGHPYMQEATVLAVSRFAGFAVDRPTDYVLATVAQRHGVLLGKAIEKLTLCEADEAAATALGVAMGIILLRLDRIVSSLAGEPVEWRVGLCPLQNEQYVVTMN